jgi:protease II
LPDTVERVDDFAWATDNRTIFYVTEDPVTKRHDKFWRHIVGATASDLVYEEKDEEFDLACGEIAGQGRRVSGVDGEDVDRSALPPRRSGQRSPEPHRPA